MGIFNPDNTPNALGSLGFVMSNEGLLQDGKPLSGSGGQAVAQAMAQAIAWYSPCPTAFRTCPPGGVTQLQYFRSSPQGAQHWLGKSAREPQLGGLNVGDEAGSFAATRASRSSARAFRYRASMPSCSPAAAWTPRAIASGPWPSLNG